MKNIIFTIGHSTHSIETFIEMLRRHKISAICDVRSSPYSRFNPQYNKESLREILLNYDIKYVFLGKELGARSDDPSCYKDGRVQYGTLAKTALFESGIERIRVGVDRGYKMALMCAEKDPLDCHRTILVARNLEQAGFSVLHIQSDGALETQDEANSRLVKQFKLDHDDLFLSAHDLLQSAYLKQEKKIAYIETDVDSKKIKRAV